MRVLDLARIAFVGTAAIAALSSAARAADFDDDQRVCSQPGVGADVRIVVCTRQIESGRLEGDGLAVPYNSRGFAYREKGDVDHAIADFSQAIQLNPKYTFAWFNRGKTYADKKDLDHAVADYSEAIKLDPNNIDAYYLRGKAYLAKKDYDSAIADYNHLIEGNPKIAAAVYNDRGVAYTNKNDIDRAIADYSQAIQLDPKDAQAYTNRALMYQAKGDLDHAIADFTQTIALKPSFGLYYSRAIAYRDKRNYDDAIADYSKAIEINPKQLDLIHNRAAAYRHKGDFRSAMADYTREIELDPKIWAAFFSRGPPCGPDRRFAGRDGRSHQGGRTLARQRVCRAVDRDREQAQQRRQPVGRRIEATRHEELARAGGPVLSRTTHAGGAYDRRQQWRRRGADEPDLRRQLLYRRILSLAGQEGRRQTALCTGCERRLPGRHPRAGRRAGRTQGA